MPLSQHQIKQGQQRGTDATRGKRTGMAAQVDRKNTEAGFRKREDFDLQWAKGKGVSETFLRTRGARVFVESEN